MFFEELIQHLTDKGYSYSLDYYDDDDEEKDMIYIEHDGDIILPIESLSGNICFSNHGKVELPNLKTTDLCSNIWFDNKGKVFLPQLQIMQGNLIEFNNLGDVDMPELKTIAACISFSTCKNINFPNLIEILDEIEFCNKRDIYAPKLGIIKRRIAINTEGDLHVSKKTPANAL